MGCMCSTVPFQFKWLKGYICSSCYYHHQIGSIHFSIIIFSVVVCLRCLMHYFLPLIVYTFRENRDFVFIIVAQFMMSAYSRIRFGLQIVFVCLYITPSYYHHCANIELMICLSDIFCRVYRIKNILSFIHYTIYGAVCFQFTYFTCDDWENICFVLLSSSHGEFELISIFRVRSWNNGMHCMYCYILINKIWIALW